jgi:hypothetical protein
MHMSEVINRFAIFSQMSVIYGGHLRKNGGHVATEHFSDIWENMSDI